MTDKPKRSESDDEEAKKTPDAKERQKEFAEEAGRRASTGPENGEEKGSDKEEKEARSH